MCLQEIQHIPSRRPLRTVRDLATRRSLEYDPDNKENNPNSANKSPAQHGIQMPQAAPARAPSPPPPAQLAENEARLNVVFSPRGRGVEAATAGISGNDQVRDQQNRRFASAHANHLQRSYKSPAVVKQQLEYQSETTELENLFFTIVQWPQRVVDQLHGSLVAGKAKVKLNLNLTCAPGKSCTLLEDVVEGVVGTNCMSGTSAAAQLAAATAARVARAAASALATPLQDLLASLIALEGHMIGEDDSKYRTTADRVEAALRFAGNAGGASDVNSSHLDVSGGLAAASRKTMHLAEQMLDTQVRKQQMLREVASAAAMCAVRDTTQGSRSSRSKPCRTESAFTFSSDHIRRSYQRQLRKLIREYTGAVQSGKSAAGSGSATDQPGRHQSRDIMPLLTRYSETELLAQYAGQEERLMQKIKKGIEKVKALKHKQAMRRHRMRMERARALQIAAYF